MNWIKSGTVCVAAVLTSALATACGTGAAVPSAPTAIPTSVVQIMPSATPIRPVATPIPPSPVSTSTRTVAPTQQPVPPTQAAARTVVPTQQPVVPTQAATRTVAFTSTPSPKDMLMAAFAKALAGLKTYRVEVPQESRYIAVQLPDRFIQEGEDGIVKIGATLWFVAPQGIRMGTGSMPFFDRANLNWYKDQFAQSSQVVLLGPGVAGEVPCIGYSTNFQMARTSQPKTPGAAPEISQVPMPVKIWFATTDGFPRRVDIGAPMSLTINFFDLNEPIIINPPQ